MKVLLDTHSFLWWESNSARLTSSALALCKRQDVTLMLSLASVWEMQIKVQIGKLNLKPILSEIIKRQRIENKIQILPIRLPHIYALERLRPHHKDPFDRMIIAQAMTENCPVISADQIFQHYPVNVIW